MAYRVRLTDRVRLQLQDAPPQLQGFVAGVVAFLQVDPSAASVAFPVITHEDYRTIVLRMAVGSLITRSSRTASSSSSTS